MYFRLNPESLLTTGDEGSIICDVFTNKIYHLNRDETNLIVLAENNYPINLNEPFYHELENECLGTFYENIPYIHKIRKGSFFQKNIDFSFKSFFFRIN